MSQPGRSIDGRRLRRCPCSSPGSGTSSGFQRVPEVPEVPCGCLGCQVPQVPCFDRFQLAAIHDHAIEHDLRIEDQRAIAGGAQLDAARAEAQLDVVAEIGERSEVEAIDEDLQRLARLDFEPRKPVSGIAAAAASLRWSSPTP